jgi:hypothetical protein
MDLSGFHEFWLLKDARILAAFLHSPVKILLFRQLDDRGPVGMYVMLGHGLFRDAGSGLCIPLGILTVLLEIVRTLKWEVIKSAKLAGG